jgi:peptidoglycan glycosyltransferase
MNTPLRRVGLAIMVLTLLLLANATYIQVVKADSYRTDPRNQRVLLDQYSRQRGLILDTTGNVKLADVKATNDRLKFLRTYPGGKMYAPVTGYYSVQYGSTGLERAADDTLNGSDDRLFVRRLSDLITGRDPSGGSIQTTIDTRVQKAAYDAMTSNGYKGATVAIKPNTGEILAMVSTPSFDPNPLASHNTSVEEKAKTKLDKDPDEPLTNRAISNTYPPGSTFKLVTAAAALSNGMGKDTKLPTQPTITLPHTHTTSSNFGFETCPGDTMFDALAHSCNTAFETLAGKVGKQKLEDQAGKFGIGQPDLKIPTPVAQSSIDPIQDQAALYTSGIGQHNVRLTALQDAMIGATIANGGNRMNPQLIKQILAPDLSVLEGFSPDSAGQAVSPSVASTLKDMMLASEANTTGGQDHPGLKIASKTGTAEHGVDPKAVPPHAWYVGFAPADNPQIAVATIVENGGNEGLAATGGKVAAAVARAAIQAGLGGH